MNRDYYKRPIQGHSRSQHDYGNTHLGESDQRPHGTGFAIALPIGVVLWAVGLLVWWLA